MNERLIFLTNDDGFDSRGMEALIDIARRFGRVVVVAPERPQSGMSHAFTMLSPLFIRKVREKEGLEVYALSGTPVDCVKVAFDYLLRERKVDLVLSGINHGSNSAVALLYSGTMGAAMEGAAFGIPSVGFSLTDHAMDADFSPCLPAIDLLVKAILENGLPQDVCLNVNVPDVDFVPREMRLCTPCRGHWNDEYKEYTDPFGRKFYWLTGRFENLEPDNERTDEWSLAHGMISVVPVSIERSADTCLDIDWLPAVLARYARLAAQATD